MTARLCAIAAVAALVNLAPQRPDPAAGQAALMAADRDFAQATAQRRIDGWVKAFGDSGLQFIPNRPIAKGRAAVRDNMSRQFADTTWTLSWEPHFAEIAAAGDLGLTVGHYTSRRTGADGQPISRGLMNGSTSSTRNSG